MQIPNFVGSQPNFIRAVAYSGNIGPPDETITRVCPAPRPLPHHSATSTAAETILPTKHSSSRDDRLHREPGPAARSPDATVSYCSDKTSSAAELDDVQCLDESDSGGPSSSSVLHLERGSYGPDCEAETIKVLNRE